MKLTLKSKGFRAEKIFIYDKELTRVKKIQVNMSGKEIPTATIELMPDEIEVDGEFSFIKEKALKDYSVEELYKAIEEKTNNSLIKNSIVNNKIIVEIDVANANIDGELLAKEISERIKKCVNLESNIDYVGEIGG